MPTSWTAKKTSLTYCFILLLFFVPIFFLFEEAEEPLVVLEDVVLPEPSPVPDFANILDVQLKKQTFFNYIEPYVHEVNDAILVQRNRVLEIRDKLNNGQDLSQSDLGFLNRLAEQYELEVEDYSSQEFLTVLLRRVDKIPVSLALAQAANESAWGTSRFAQDGNNFFGQWCYTDGCGIVPSRRRLGDIHEVRSFASVKDSVQSYIHNLNTFPSYQMLRRLRQQLRQLNRPLDGATLADGLESYSQRGHDYIDELQTMIYTNNLLARDRTTL